MSLVVAVKDKGRVVLGSDKQASTGYSKSHDTTKIWEVQELGGALMGGVGSMRASQVIQYSRLIDMNEVADKGGSIDTDFVINCLVPMIVGQLRVNGVVTTPPEDKDQACSTMIPNVFIFAYGDKAWMIWHDLSVSELGDYLAIGSGSDIANGALYATRGKDPFKRIVTCINAAADSNIYVDSEVDLLATDYLDEDDKRMAIALGEVASEEEYDEIMKKLEEAAQKKQRKKKPKKKAAEKAAESEKEASEEQKEKKEGE